MSQNQISEELIESYLSLPQDIRWQLVAKNLGYVKVPPTIDEFIESDEYLGLILNNGESIYPVWRNALRRIYPNPFYSPFVEVIITGAIGIGKTTVAKIGMAYDLARLLLLKNPQKTFNLLPTTTIVYLIFTSTLQLAHSVILGEILEWFEISPFFRERLYKAENDKYHLFPNRITIEVGSRSRHALGKAVFGAVLDEANFQVVNNQVYENYTNIKRRMQSRFSDSGRLPGHVWLISSKTTDVAFLQQHIEKSKNDPDTIVFDYPLWEVKKHLLNLSGKYFEVYQGDDARDPFIIRSEFDKRDLNPERIIKVPIEFKKEFEYDIYNALRDLAGVYTRVGTRFIPSIELITQSMKIPQFVLSEPIRYNGSHNFDILEFLSPEFEEYLNQTKDSPRFLHLDLAYRHDRIGIALSRFDRWIVMTRKDVKTGKLMKINEPSFIVDLVLAIETPQQYEFPLFLLKDFITNLQYKYGVYIDTVSADQFQSKMLLQEVAAMGFRTDTISVDRTMEPYLYLRRLLGENRITLPKSELLKKELSELIDTGSKVDHPRDGSKDVADAVAGSVWSVFRAIVEGRMLVYNTNSNDMSMNRDVSLRNVPISLYLIKNKY